MEGDGLERLAPKEKTKSQRLWSQTWYISWIRQLLANRWQKPPSVEVWSGSGSGCGNVA